MVAQDRPTSDTPTASAPAGAAGRAAAPERGRRRAILHPATELVLLACALLVTYGVPSPVVPVTILSAAVAAALWSPRVRFGRWAATFAVLAVPMLVMVGIIQGLFYPGDGATVLWWWGPASVTVEGLSVALQLWLRVAAMIAVCALFAFGADVARTFDGMIRLRAPLGIAYVCATAMSLIPLLRDQTGDALTARAARGWDTTRFWTRARILPGILAGLLTSSLVSLDQRHDTLAQRGFGRARPAAIQDHPDGALQRCIRWAAPVLALALVVLTVTGTLHLPAASEIWGGAYD